MSVDVARVTATSGVLATAGPLNLLSVHYSAATGGTGTVQLRDGTTATTTVKLTLDVPRGSSVGDFSLNGAGLVFENGVFASLSNTGGCTISYHDRSG